MRNTLSKLPVQRLKKGLKNAPRFQHALDVVEALPFDERDMVINILQKRRNEARRSQLAESIKKADREYERGEVIAGSIDEVLAALADD